MYTNMAESEVECFSGVKTAKAEGRCSWGNFTLRKTKIMHSETASNQRSEENVHILLTFALETSCLWYSIKCQTRGVPEVMCAQSQTTTSMSRHNSRWLAGLVPPKNPINACSLSWVPELLLGSTKSFVIPDFVVESGSLYRGSTILSNLLPRANLEFFHEKRGLGLRYLEIK